jgi:DNA-binding beta-propeller fold protein YncE
MLGGPAACREAKPSVDITAPLVLERTIPLKGVAGRIDHLALDAGRGRLFVAALGNGTVEVIDLTRGAPIGRIDGLKEPQGVAYLPAQDALAIASGGDGSVRFYRAGDLKSVGSISVGKDADNLRVDPRTGNLVVGYGSGALAAIDPTHLKILARLALPGHPEGFQLDGARAFVNLPTGRRIVVGDLAGGGRIVASWPAGSRLNFPMALDAASHTLAVVYRLPARAQLLDTKSGAVRSDRSTCGDADDVFIDQTRQRIYVICGSGSIDIFGLNPSEPPHRIDTRPGARTGLFSPELDRLFVAARASRNAAAILVYRPQP